MKKLILLAVVLTAVSCERDDEKVGENIPEKTSKIINKTIENEKTSSKTASDTIFVKNISPDAGFEITDPIDDVDPKDITPPRR
ncbi:hypothetical protein [Chryseobacterium sp. ZHDP1]|uniref:hypothetical protein n=1 Tax=Chryseobacterium sp. ZHDP1 TaxID=2838877 RepID=UPI001BDFAF9C|nr:hypothetical protein [Chryseobacterium sp. ZHDP1]QWA38840.1 hypothetical protein KKI44_01100 [Chryseobacterium sp. ZHDP1]